MFRIVLSILAGIYTWAFSTAILFFLFGYLSLFYDDVLWDDFLPIEILIGLGIGILVGRTTYIKLRPK